jgi:hypothetical protein
MATCFDFSRSHLLDNSATNNWTSNALYHAISYLCGSLYGQTVYHTTMSSAELNLRNVHISLRVQNKIILLRRSMKKTDRRRQKMVLQTLGAVRKLLTYFCFHCTSIFISRRNGYTLSVSFVKMPCIRLRMRLQEMGSRY